MIFHWLMLGVGIAAIPFSLWTAWRDYRELAARHRQIREALRWRHFEEMMRVSYWSWVIREHLEDEEEREVR